MFASMLYKGFKAGEKMFHLFTDNATVDPQDYEKLAVEMIKFAGELKAALKAQEDAAATPDAPAAEPVEAPKVEVSQP